MSVAKHDGDGAATLRLDLRGDLDVETAPGLYKTLMQAARRRGLRRLCLDFTKVESLDSAGVAAVTLGRRALERSGKTLELEGLSEIHAAAFSLQPTHAAVVPTEQRGALERLGARTYRTWKGTTEWLGLVGESTWAIVRCLAGRDRFPVGSTLEQATLIGVDALPIVTMLSFLLGLVLAFQSVYGLSEFGAEVYTSEIVALGMTREFGGFITAMIIAGRSGAAIAAEIGTMTVEEEVDALRSMGVSPIRILVVPRVIAITMVQPALSLMAMLIGIGGGLLIAPLLDMSFVSLYDRMLVSLDLGDFALGLIKSVLFAWVIGLVGCYRGLQTRGGPTSVGRSATSSVVTSIFYIVVIDSIVTTIWTLSQGGL